MKVYRGYNKDYPNWGMREGQNHIWTTDDMEYALEYTNIFDNGGLVEFEIDDNMMNVADEYDYEDILGDDFGGDPIDADNTTCQIIKNEGYNVIHFESGDNDIFLILDRSLIKSAKEIALNDDIDEEINEVWRISGINPKHINKETHNRFKKDDIKSETKTMNYEYDAYTWKLSNNINESREQLDERLFPELSDRKYNELLWFTTPNMTANAYTKFFGKEMIADRIPAKYLVTLSSNDISLKDLVEKHRKLYNTKQVKPIADYKDFNDFITDLNKSKYLSRNDKSNIAKSGAKIIKSFGDWDLYDITTWEAAKKYGSGTTWCVTDSTSDDYFKRYTNRLPFNNDQTEEDMKKSTRRLLFLINPNTDRKMAISVFKRIDYNRYSDSIEFYNEEDEFFYTYEHTSKGSISSKDDIVEKITSSGDYYPTTNVVEDYGVTEDFINSVIQFIKDMYRMNEEEIVEDINKLRQNYKQLMNIKESANNSTNMTWEEFVEKVGRINEFDGSVLISKYNTSIIIKQSGIILIRVGKKPYQKAYSNLKTFDEIYNMLVEKGFIEEQILTEGVNQHSLYHGCDLAYAVSMMIDNAMRGETIANINGKKYQGNSLTRSLQFAKDWQEERWDGHGDELNQFWVVLELNKERLKTKYKVLPYNYWEDYFGKDYEHTIDRNGYGNQYEEFVVGRINNLMYYMDDVYLSDECFDVEYAEIFALVKRELELRGENYTDSQIVKALQTLGIDKPSPNDFDGEELDENYGGMPMVYPNPTYSEFHDIMRRFTTTGTLSAIIDGDDIYCWDSYYIHHGTMIRYIEDKMDIKISDNAIWVRFKEPNKVCVSGAYFDDYDDDELEELETQDFEEELKYNPVIRKYFPKGVKVVRYDRLDEEIAFGKMLNDEMITILKNPTRNELKKNNINHARIVVDDYGNIYFGLADRYSHAMMVHELERNNISEFKILGPEYDWGVDVFLYDQTFNTFYYRVDYMSKEEEKEKLKIAKDFLNTSYFNKSFGDFHVQITDKEEPWEK